MPHTATGLVDTLIRLSKQAARKMLADCDAQGLIINKDLIVMEATMAQNLTLNYGGHCPAQGLLGVHTKRFLRLRH